MKQIKSILLTFLALCMTTSLFAHALWIETKGTGKVGEAQEVKVFYGEYAENERDVISKWYSDVKDLSLWLVGPDQKKIKLNTTLNDNAAIATFTPEKDGHYTLLVSHDAKELGGTTKYQFLTSATVQVGKSPASINGDAISNDLKIFPVSANNYKVNKPIQLKAIHKGELKAETSVSVFSPSGWSRVLTTGSNGELEFTPLWPGKYVVEITNFDKTKGEHNGQAYEAVWQGSTYSFDVK